jgi:hypothetical protein
MNHEAFSIAGGDVPRRLACPRACSASGISLGATRQLVAATSWGVGTQKKEVRGVPPAEYSRKGDQHDALWGGACAVAGGSRGCIPPSGSRAEMIHQVLSEFWTERKRGTCRAALRAAALSGADPALRAGFGSEASLRIRK